MEIINGYRLLTPLKNDNSGFAKWGFAEKFGRQFFIKEFLSPVYPLDATVLSKEQIARKRDICDKFAASKRNFYNQLNKCSTGNVVTVCDFFRFGSKYYMITDKVDAAAIAPEAICRLTYEQKILLVKVILHCINSLHKHGIVHCDIKPNNILFKKTNKGMYTAKIIDFDSSFLESNPPTMDDELQGDLVYLAPEACLFIMEEEAELSTKIDIFALGILFHQYFCGALPGFDHNKYDYTHEAVLNDYELDINPHIPTHIRDMIKMMLAKEPKDRPSVDQLLDMIGINLTPPKPEVKPNPNPGTGPFVTTHIPEKNPSGLKIFKANNKGGNPGSGPIIPAKDEGASKGLPHEPMVIIDKTDESSKSTSAGGFFKVADDL